MSDRSSRGVSPAGVWVREIRGARPLRSSGARVQWMLAATVLLASSTAPGSARAAEEIDADAEPVSTASRPERGRGESGEGRRDPRKSKERARVLGFVVDFDLEASAAGGLLSDGATVEERASAALVAARLRPRLRRRDLQLRFPVAFTHRQTFGGSLSETAAGAGAGVAYQIASGWRLALDAGARGKYRPFWPDPYQPDAAGGLLGTDRYSYLELFAQTEIGWRPTKNQRVRLEYELSDFDYRTDREFEDADPTHLTPRDRAEHRATLSWSYRQGGLAFGTAADVYWRVYADLFARDAGTGLTHATSTRQSPNPSLTLRGAEPAVFAEVVVGNAATVRGAYGYEIREDLFQGYYSRRGHHPEIEVRLATPLGLSVQARVEVNLRRYGPNSYAVDCQVGDCPHSPLEEGKRLAEQRLEIGLELAQRLTERWALFAQGEFLRRRSNYPDYKPNLFPRTKTYDINWDYENWQAFAGVRYEE